MPNTKSYKTIIELMIETNIGEYPWELKSSSGILIRKFQDFKGLADYVNETAHSTLVVIYVTDVSSREISKYIIDGISFSSNIVFVDSMREHKNVNECIIVQNGSITLEINGRSILIGTWDTLCDVKRWLTKYGRDDVEVRFIADVRSRFLTKDEAINFADMIDGHFLDDTPGSKKSEKGKDEE